MHPMRKHNFHFLEKLFIVACIVLAGGGCQPEHKQSKQETGQNYTVISKTVPSNHANNSALVNPKRERMSSRKQGTHQFSKKFALETSRSERNSNSAQNDPTLERDPKSGYRFPEKSGLKDKQLEHSSDPIRSEIALSEIVIAGDEKLSHRPTNAPAPSTEHKQNITLAANMPSWAPMQIVTQTGRARPSNAAARASKNGALASFFKALARLKNGTGKQVTILHLGDSHIAADRFSGDLRDEFQLSFGDAGRGMLMPGLYLARGVKFEQGGDWKVAVSAMGTPGPYSLTGVKVSSSNRNAWMRLTSVKAPFDWAEITFETGPQGGSVFLSLDGQSERVSTAEQMHSWKTIRLQRTAREILIKPEGNGQIIMHSITIGSNKPGVRYVSFGVPSATAATPLSWTPALVQNDLKRLAPDLIIFGYGTEESLKGKLDLARYEASVNTSLFLLRKAAPQASIIVLGPPDLALMPTFAIESGKMNDVCSDLDAKEKAGYARAIRKRDPRIAHWHPPLQLDAIRHSLKRIAAANNAYFWDWSKVMGGTCGIHAWVHSTPPLAVADHVHLTEEGSKRSARVLFRELMTAFEGYFYTSSTTAK